MVRKLPNITTIPRRIKEARLILGISKEKLGIAVGIKKLSASSDINQYENGKRIPGFLILKKIAKNLSVPMAYFYAEDDMLAKFLFLYGKINKKSRKQLLEFCKNISIQ
ncbi:MAG: helix-turn-helix domain-containing protein [Gammaproteobacteria bacterium]